MKLKTSRNTTFLLLLALCSIVLLMVVLKNSSKKKYSKYASAPEVEQKTTLDFIQLTVLEKHFKKLEKKRNAALSVGILETSNTDYVPATVTFNGNEYKAEIRLKGDWTDHLEGEKWSFRVKLKNDKTILGMRKFSLHHPKTRGYINEWLYHKAAKKEELIGLRYSFVEGGLYIKNKSGSGYLLKDVGIYAIEETFDKRTIESNKRKESVILKFSEDPWWEEVKKSLEISKKSGDSYSKFMNSDFHKKADYPITVFSQENVLADSTLLNYFKLSKNLLEDIKRGQISLSEGFDVKKLAKNTALLNLFGAIHSSYIINLRFYYNPISSKLEPIVFDGNSGGKRHDFVHFIFTNQQRDTIYLKQLAYELEKIMQPEYLKNLIDSNKSELNNFSKILKEEFRGVLFSEKNLKYNQIVLKKELLRLKTVLNLKDIKLVKVPEFDTSIKNEIATISKWVSKKAIIQEQSLKYNNKPVYKIQRKDTHSASFIIFKDINVNVGQTSTVSVVVKKGEKGELLGFRIAGKYPNRVDAVFNLNNKTVQGINKVGYFDNEEAFIKPLKNGWFQCSIKLKTNIERVSIILGSTTKKNGISAWERKSSSKSNFYFAPSETQINQN